MKDSVILTTAYLAPIQYYTKLLHYKHVVVEHFENYSKQSYRNRCNIYSANGALALYIPVQRTDSAKCLVKDVQISYDTNWQKIHFKAIESAYNSSPFYLYYIDDLLPFFTKEYKFLFDFNAEIQSVILSGIKLKPEMVCTQDYIFEPAEHCDDLREAIHPKQRMNKEDVNFKPLEYPQVFKSKYGFIPNLSIIDLLFNTGPDAKDILAGSIAV